ncbi:MAG: hypothetical protein H6724_08075 [Sandaracinus sp.]|nr:hypothetical protein [Sandaracinus sp.]
MKKWLAAGLWPLLVLTVWIAWVVARPDVDFDRTWPLGVAMLLGSFVAGATAKAAVPSRSP